MDFLKNLFGDKAMTFDELQKAINDHNQTNKDNQINIANLASGEYVSKNKYDAKEKELEKANNQIADLNDTVKKFDGDIKQLQGDLKQKQKDYDTEIINLKNGYAIDTAISQFFKDNPLKDAKYESLLKSQIKTDQLKVDGDKVIGLEDQTRGILEGYADLFGKPAPTGPTPNIPDINFKGQLNTFEAIEKNADNMTAEQVAEAFANLQD